MFVLSVFRSAGQRCSGVGSIGSRRTHGPGPIGRLPSQVIGATLFRSFEDLHHLAFRRRVAEAVGPGPASTRSLNSRLLKEKKNTGPCAEESGCVGVSFLGG